MCTLYSEGGLCPESAGVRPLPPQVQGGARQGVPLPWPRKAFQSYNQRMLLGSGENFRLFECKNIVKISLLHKLLTGPFCFTLQKVCPVHTADCGFLESSV
jgi:hypothetical protein